MKTKARCPHAFGALLLSLAVLLLAPGSLSLQLWGQTNSTNKLRLRNAFERRMGQPVRREYVDLVVAEIDKRLSQRATDPQVSDVDRSTAFGSLNRRLKDGALEDLNTSAPSSVSIPSFFVLALAGSASETDLRREDESGGVTATFELVELCLEPDPLETIKSFKMAAAKGDKQSSQKLASIYESGKTLSNENQIRPSRPEAARLAAMLNAGSGNIMSADGEFRQSVASYPRSSGQTGMLEPQNIRLPRKSRALAPPGYTLAQRGIGTSPPANKSKPTDRESGANSETQASARQFRIFENLTLHQAQARVAELERQISAALLAASSVPAKDMFETSAEFEARKAKAIHEAENSVIFKLRQELSHLRTGVYIKDTQKPGFVSYDADRSLLVASTEGKEWEYRIARDEARKLHTGWASVRAGQGGVDGSCPFLIWNNTGNLDAKLQMIPPHHQCASDLHWAKTTDDNGGVYRIGGSVSPPTPIFKVEPEYSEEARKAKIEGTMVLAIIVDQEGRPRNIRVVQSLGMGLDEKAIEAVSKWRFRPARKDGKAVAVHANVEVNFRSL